MNHSKPFNKTLLHILSIIVLLSANMQPTYSQSIWGNIKEKAKEAWNSDTRKEAWEKTKEKAKEAWNSDTRKEAWEKTKDKTKELYNRGKESEIGQKTQELYDKHSYIVPITKRKFLNVIPDSYILSLSKDQYRTYLRQSKISTNSKHISQVKRVANRMSQAVKKLYRDCGMSSELSNFSWEFNVVQNKDANAFCMPGGKIIVYDGILPIAGSDDALAVVMGHEIAHAIAKHSAEQMTKRVIEIGGMTIAYSIISNSNMSKRNKVLSNILTSAGITLMDLKFSRNNETEADRIGLILTAMAGYNPEAAVGFWQRMGEKSGNKSTHDWYSTHPSNSNRIQNIKGMLPEAKRYKK